MKPSDVIELISSIGFFGFLVYFILFHPEKFEKFSSYLWKWIRFFYRGAEKQYIRHDIQGRVNDFVSNKLTKELTNFEPIKIKIEWVNEDQTKEDFISNGQIVVRMRQSDNQNKNFVNASMVFVAQNLLVKAKRYISQKQKESIDLFACKKLFEDEKHEIIDQFVQTFLIDKTEDDKISNYFDKYDLIDKAGLFFPVFIQEMTFLGEKVFAKRKDDTIIKEVNNLIEFLEKYSQRTIGEEEIPKEFHGVYCNFSIMIIGKSFKVNLQGKNPYINVLGNHCKNKIQTLYLIGSTKHKDFIDDVAKDTISKNEYEIFNTKKYNSIINYDDGTSRTVQTYLVVLRYKNPETYFNSKSITE